VFISFPRFGIFYAIISLNRFFFVCVCVSSVCISVPSCTLQIHWLGLSIMSLRSWRLSSWLLLFLYCLLSECNNSSTLSSIPAILSSVWSRLLVILSFEFLFDLLSFLFSRFPLVFFFFPPQFISLLNFHLSLEMTSLLHLSVHLNSLWGYWSFLKIDFGTLCVAFQLLQYLWIQLLKKLWNFRGVILPCFFIFLVFLCYNLCICWDGYHLWFQMEVFLVFFGSGAWT
jgi:hypothetical protein